MEYSTLVQLAKGGLSPDKRKELLKIILQDDALWATYNLLVGKKEEGALDDFLEQRERRLESLSHENDISQPLVSRSSKNMGVMANTRSLMLWASSIAASIILAYAVYTKMPESNPPVVVHDLTIHDMLINRGRAAFNSSDYMDLRAVLSLYPEEDNTKPINLQEQDTVSSITNLAKRLQPGDTTGIFIQVSGVIVKSYKKERRKWFILKGETGNELMVLAQRYHETGEKATIIGVLQNAPKSFCENGYVLIEDL